MGLYRTPSVTVGGATLTPVVSQYATAKSDVSGIRGMAAKVPVALVIEYAGVTCTAILDADMSDEDSDELAELLAQKLDDDTGSVT